MAHTKLCFLLLIVLVGCIYTEDYEAPPVPVKETILSISGLASQPNPYGELPPGSLKVADNVVMRRPGVLETLPKTEVFHAISGTRPLKLFATPTKMVALQGSTATATAMMWYDLVSATAKTTVVHGTTTRALNFFPGKSYMETVRARYIFTEATSPIVYDAEVGTPRLVGLPPPASMATAVDYPGTVVANGNSWSYKSHFQRDFSDGYKVVGGVSPPCAGENTSGATYDLAGQVTWNKATWPVVAGDKIYIYRTKQQSTIDALGDDYRLAKIITISAGDITNGYALFTDRTLDDALGDALYTNEYQDGANQTNWMPPPATDVKVFKNATFYRSRVGWQELEITIPNQIGALTTASERTDGIGSRTFVGDRVLGSPNITNVSAADRVGLVVGQLIESGGGFAVGATISSITGAGPYTIVANSNALDTVVGATYTSYDYLYVNGTAVKMYAAGRVSEDVSEISPVMAFPSRVVDNTSTAVTGIVFLFAAPVSGSATFALKATNGQNYSPALSYTVGMDSTSDNRDNRLYFSKIQQPEAVPPLNYRDVGNGTILRMVTTQDALYVFCTDGIYRITGDGSDWRIDPFNPTTLLLHPDGIDTLDNTIFAWTDDGLVAMTDQSIDSMSAAIENKFLNRWTQFKDAGTFPYTWGPSVTADPYRKEVWVNFMDSSDPANPTFYESYIFNNVTKAWTTQSQTQPFSVAYSPFLLATVLATITDLEIPDAGTITGGDLAVNGAQPATVEFNPLLAGEAGDLKQWMDVVYFLEDADITFAPTFDGTSVVSWAVTGTDDTNLRVPIPRRVASSKQLRPGFTSTLRTISSTNYWRLLGLSVRLRVASDVLRR